MAHKQDPLARALLSARRVRRPGKAGSDLVVRPVVLEGEHVRLVPMRRSHVPRLWEVGRHPDLWRVSPSRIRTASDMRRYVEAALASQRAGTALPFVTLDRSTGRVIGTSRFGNIAPRDRRLEIGWTWITPEFQRTPANTEAKLLMLRHAFETLGCLRVEFKTDVLNARSRAALARIGAKEEGVHRQQIIGDDGRVRDSIYFSILDTEWPRVQRGLVAKLRRKWRR